MEDEIIPIKSNVSINDHSSFGLLDKLQLMKENQASTQQIVKDHSIALIKTSNDPEIARLCSLFVSSSPNDTPIGLRLNLKTITVSEKTVLNLKVYEYNYLVAKKFKYLKAEAVNASLTLLVIINIYDKKCLNNLKQIFEELGAKGASGINANINYQSSSNNSKLQFGNKNIVIALLKTTNNFLMKITERQNVNAARKEIEDILSGTQVRIVELDVDEINDVNQVLIDLTK